MSGPFKMKGHSLPGINQRSSPVKDLGHGGHEGLSQEEAAKRRHGDKMSEKDIALRKKRNEAKTNPSTKDKISKVINVVLGNSQEERMKRNIRRKTDKGAAVR